MWWSSIPYLQLTVCSCPQLSWKDNSLRLKWYRTSLSCSLVRNDHSSNNISYLISLNYYTFYNSVGTVYKQSKKVHLQKKKKNHTSRRPYLKHRSTGLSVVHNDDVTEGTGHCSRSSPLDLPVMGNQSKQRTNQPKICMSKHHSFCGRSIVLQSEGSELVAAQKYSSILTI